jgi:hypothetical protein
VRQLVGALVFLPVTQRSHKQQQSLARDPRGFAFHTLILAQSMNAGSEAG